MSWPCGRIWAGKIFGIPLPSHPVTLSTEMDESIHVSSTSSSPANSVLPHVLQGWSGFASVGSTGRSFSSGTAICPHFLQNQTGIGVAKIRCREMHQSHSIWDVQFSILRSMCSGYHAISWAAFRISSGLTFTNHWRSDKISIGVLQRQQVPTRWASCSCLCRIFPAFISARMAFLHSCVFSPAYFPARLVIFPWRSIALRSARLCCFHQWTSCLSPNVQIMTAPDPNSGSTASSWIMGTLWPKIGTVRCFPFKE